MPRAWSAKRERQYEHIKEGLLDQGRSTDKAEEIAARTVNKERARAGGQHRAPAQRTRRSRFGLRSGRRRNRSAHDVSEGFLCR